MRTLLRITLGLALVFTLNSWTLQAASTGAAPADADQEVRELKALVKQLEARLEKLEGRQADRAEAQGQAAQAGEATAEVEQLKKAQTRTNRRLMQVERNQGLDRVHFSGDYRFEAHSIDGTQPAHFDGMQLQNLLVDTLFFTGATGRMPGSLEEIQGTVRSHYSDYQYFTQGLTFDQLRGMVGQVPAEQQQMLFGFLMPHTLVPKRNADNNILYTNRLRLNLDAHVADHVSFTGRLGMYKVFGDSTGVQVFNGQSSSMNIDGTTVGVPNSDVLRVERAFFTWGNIGNSPLYLSVGRRPSSGGAPVNFRQDEPRGGTPAASLIDYQFDGITVGYHLGEKSTLRLCYGVGYESGFGNGSLLKAPQDRLSDTHFFGINWDLWNTEDMSLQATVARAFDVTDGFNGLVSMPNNPVTGQPIGAPLVMRFTPSKNLGAINLAGLVLTRRDGPIDWFVNGNLMSSDPDPVVTPFGGLFADPFDTPESRTGGMVYAGARLSGNSERTKLGFEFNHGSKYWFNFAAAEDDFIAPKTAARGNVFEAYLTHRIASRFIFKAGYIFYDYEYSGSGWHVGAPKKLDAMPLLGFPTYDKVGKLALSLTARF